MPDCRQKLPESIFRWFHWRPPRGDTAASQLWNGCVGVWCWDSVCCDVCLSWCYVCTVWSHFFFCTYLSEAHITNVQLCLIHCLFLTLTIMLSLTPKKFLAFLAFLAAFLSYWFLAQTSKQKRREPWEPWHVTVALYPVALQIAVAHGCNSGHDMPCRIVTFRRWLVGKMAVHNASRIDLKIYLTFAFKRSWLF